MLVWDPLVCIEGEGVCFAGLPGPLSEASDAAGITQMKRGGQAGMFIHCAYRAASWSAQKVLCSWLACSSDSLDYCWHVRP